MSAEGGAVGAGGGAFEEAGDLSLVSAKARKVRSLFRKVNGAQRLLSLRARRLDSSVRAQAMEAATSWFPALSLIRNKFRFVRKSRKKEGGAEGAPAAGDSGGVASPSSGSSAEDADVAGEERPIACPRAALAAVDSADAAMAGELYVHHIRALDMTLNELVVQLEAALGYCERHGVSVAFVDVQADSYESKYVNVDDYVSVARPEGGDEDADADADADADDDDDDDDDDDGGLGTPAGKVLRPRVPPNPVALGMCLHYVNKYLLLCEDVLWEAERDAGARQFSQRQLGALFIQRTKLDALVELLPYAADMRRDDIALQRPRKPLRCEARRRPEDPAAFQRDLDRFFRRVALGASFVDAGIEYSEKNAFMQTWTMGLGALYYGLQPSLSDARGELVNAHGSMRTQKVLWNLTDTAIARQVYGLALENVDGHRTFYVVPPGGSGVGGVGAADDGGWQVIDADDVPPPRDPRLDPPVHVRLMTAADPSDGGGNADGDERAAEERRQESEESPPPAPKPGRSCAMRRPRLGRRKKKKEVKANEQQQQQQRQHEAAREETKGTEKPRSPTSKASAIVVQIHGGGFVGMSSFSHQNYTRQWVNATGTPVVAVDYRLAPEHPFPAALDDCWNAYRWAAEEHPSSRVILAGDSAGGNLAAAVVVRAIRTGYRLPDGLVLAYPALSLVKSFSPSLLLSMDDRMVPYTFLQRCLEAYVGPDPSGQRCRHPLISPGLAADVLLAQFPPTRVMVGTLDPLHDDCVRWAERLAGLGVDTQLVVYEDLPHGILNFDTPLNQYAALRAEAHKAVEQTVVWIRQLGGGRGRNGGGGGGGDDDVVLGVGQEGGPTAAAAAPAAAAAAAEDGDDDDDDDDDDGGVSSESDDEAYLTPRGGAAD